MADFGRRGGRPDRGVVVRGDWEGKDLERGFRNTTEKVKKASEDLANKTGGLVNEKMGRAMSQFNEKTEKGRQLMTAFGGAIGGTAGQVTYYTGTISYVIGRFKKWELITMGVLGALTALGVKLYQMATEDLDKATKAMKKMNEESERFIDNTNKMVTAELAQLAGLSNIDLKIGDVRKRYAEVSHQLETLRAAKAKEGGPITLLGTVIGTPEERDDEIRKAEEDLNRLDLLMQRLVTIGKLKEKKKKPKGKTEVYESDWDQAEEDILIADAAMKAALAHAKEFEEKQWVIHEMGLEHERAKVQERADLEQAMTQVYDEEAQKRADIAAEELAKEKQKYKIRMKYAEMAAGAIGEGLQAMLSFSRAAFMEELNAWLKTKAIQAVAQSMYQIALAIGTSFINPAESASHWKSAGVFAAFAALYGGGVAATAGAAGGGGASVSARERAQGRERTQQESKEPSVMNVYIGGKYVGRAINDALEGYQNQKNPGRRRTEVK